MSPVSCAGLAVDWEAFPHVKMGPDAFACLNSTLFLLYTPHPKLFISGCVHPHPLADPVQPHLMMQSFSSFNSSERRHSTSMHASVCSKQSSISCSLNLILPAFLKTLGVGLYIFWKKYDHLEHGFCFQQAVSERSHLWELRVYAHVRNDK